MIRVNKAMSFDFGLGPQYFIVTIVTNGVLKVCGIENEVGVCRLVEFVDGWL